MFDSGAILFYLAEKTGKMLPVDPRGRHRAMQWLMWQMSGLGPMHGQAHHFIRYAPGDHPYSQNRYLNEALRLLDVMNHRLGEADYLAGDYSVADIACWPWIRGLRLISVSMDDYPNIVRWYREIESRPAVQRGGSVINDTIKTRPASEKVALTERHWSNLFGDRQRAGG